MNRDTDHLSDDTDARRYAGRCQRKTWYHTQLPPYVRWNRESGRYYRGSGSRDEWLKNKNEFEHARVDGKKLLPVFLFPVFLPEKSGKDESKGDKRYEIYENAGIWQ